MSHRTTVRIAIPEPTSFDSAYNQRWLPQYLAALHSAGAIPILIPLHESQERVARILATTCGILLPGTGADIDPQKYGEVSVPECAKPDPARSAVDELLIQDAFNLHKPVLGICYGAQALNVWCGGTIVQDIPSQIGTAVDHAPERTVVEAHPVLLTPNTRLTAIASHVPVEEANRLTVNSSHHQAIRTVGDNLVISALSPGDGVIEAVELPPGNPHFVLAVQWHPERSYIQSAFSRAIFAAFVHAAESWIPRKIEESVLQA